MLLIISTAITVIFAIHALTHGLEAAAKMLSLYWLFIRKVFIISDGSKLAKNKNFLELFKLIICHSEGVFLVGRWFFLYNPFKFLISCCPNKIENSKLKF